MESGKVFRTKSGFCHVLPNQIVLTRDGVIGSAAKVVVGTKINRILIVYGIMVLGLFVASYLSFQEGAVVEPLFLILLAAYLIFGIVNSLNNSATPIIERNSIRKLVLKKAIPGLTRSRFEVHFENEKGNIKKRLILLPGSMLSGQNETLRAVNILKEEDYI
jgi:hypothetical protein